MFVLLLTSYLLRYYRNQRKEDTFIMDVLICLLMEFTVSKAELPKERGHISQFLKDNFFKRLCVVEMFGLEEEPPPDIPDNAEFVVKAEDSRGQLIGVAFNTTTPTDLWSLDKSERERQLVQFFHYFEEQAGLEDLNGAVELWLLGVEEAWGRRGVGRRLVEESARLAVASGFRLLTMTCLNEHTARLAKGLGFLEHYRICYQDYPRLSGTDVQLKPTHPHNTLYFYIKDLRSS